MSRARMLLVVNVLLLLSIVFQAGSGLFVNAIPYDFFTRWHAWNGYLLTALAAAHLALNWNWMMANVFARRKRARKVN